MDIRDAALNHLASRARTRNEMIKYLASKDYEEEEIDDTIRYLQEFDYLNDQDYCHQYFDYGFGKGKGFRKIKQELLEKGVDAGLIDCAYEDYESEDTEYERAQLQAKKIIGGKTEIDQKLLAKVGRRLTAMGYDSDVVYQIVGTYMRGDYE